jgi:N-acetylmuramoyl-L-alanine amidase
MIGRARVMLVALLSLVALVFLAPGATLAQSPAVSADPVVLDARVTATASRARLIIDLDGATPFAIVSLADPFRIAVDVKAGALRIAAPPDVAGQGLVTGFTLEMADSGRARATLVLAGPAQVQQAYFLDKVADQPARLVVDLVPDGEASFRNRVAADKAASDAAKAKAEAEALAAAAQAAAEAAAAVPAPETRQAAPETNATPDGAAKKGAAVKPLIVVDPGHGGVDNGATAASGVHEKDLTLLFALDLQAALMATGAFDVAITRTEDTYLTLNERVDLARMNKADLFVSLHADSFQEPDISGASVYTRDENGGDVLDKVLANGEGRYDVVAGFAKPDGTPEPVLGVLLDLMRREVRKESWLAAKSIIDELAPSVALRRFPVRQADYFVLQSPDVPSVLVELGYISNLTDFANLQKPDWRSKTVSALARGIARYFEGRNKAVASQ